MKALTLKKLIKDKEQLEKLIQRVTGEVIANNPQINSLRGALAYIEDNIKNLREVKDDRKGTD